MPFKSLIEEPRCQIVRTLDIVGEKWSLLIIRNAFRGQTKFSEFRDQLGIPTDILTARLATLVENGIFEKQGYRDAGNRERSSYHLSEAGRALNIVMAAINQWGEQFNPSPWGSASTFLDERGKQKVSVAFVGESGTAVPQTKVSWAPGPASTVQW
ncbi:MAG TPA: helix-turn-helix domain-containing protein [Galbitalea sp.]|jgi:DNA-binding HxlR family transcriptional regulator|nr:helix-turn-helix domain-containing protein [Galbitalea sp.]